MACLDDTAVLRMIHGRLDGDELAGADRHLDGCARCRVLVAAVARGSDGRDVPGPDELRRGDAVGRYVVLGRLGGGAMGVVYAAHDGELDRQVALKLLRPDAGAGPDRLVREAQAMARLQHPNVVTVHDVGTTGDRVFVAMELIDGPTLRAWAAVARPWRERLEVVRAIGRGLAAAHAAGLIHRDVKPDNVIVGGDGRPRIGDFGLARRGDDGDRVGPPAAARAATITRTGAVAGTPAYMAPEQLRGEPASAASDQFGLAVTAWEVLFGARPFTGADVGAVAAAIARGPTPPRSDVPAPIVRALIRALAVEPSARWPSVAALVEALGWTPPRRWRWLAPLVATGAAAAVIVVARPGAAPADPCRAVAGELAPGWTSAVEASLRARLAATGDTTSAARLAGWVERWQGARIEVCRATHVRGAQSEAVLDVRQRCLERGAVELATLAAELLGPGTRPHVVEAIDGLTEPDECAHSPALVLLAPVAPAQRAAVAAVEAEAARLRARLAGAAPVDPGAGATLIGAAEATAHAPTVALAHLVHAELLRRAGDYPAADRAARDAIVAAERGHDDLGAARAWMARLGVAGDRRDLTAADEWLALAAAAVARAGDPAELRARLANGAGLLAMNLGRLDDAARELEVALALRRQLAGDHPDVAVARTLSALGHVARLRADHATARARFDEALAIDRAALGDAHPDVGRDLHNLANLARLAGDLDAAEAGYREALAIRGRALGPDHPEVGLTHNSLGLVALERGALDAAARELEAARRIFAAAGHGDLAITHANLGALALRRGDLVAARRWLAEAIAGYRTQLPARHERLARALLDAAEAAARAGDHREARARLAEARAAIPDGPESDALVREAAALAGRLVAVARPAAPPPPPPPPTPPTPPTIVAPPPAPAPPPTHAPQRRGGGTYGSAQGWD